MAAAAEQRAEFVICMNMDAHEGEPVAPRVVLRVGRMEERRSWYSSMPRQSQVTFTRSLVRRGAIDGGGGDTVGIWERETWERRISWEDSTNGFSNLHMMERRDYEAETEWVERRRSS